MTNEAIANRLDKLIAILQLAHREEIERARADIRSDPVNAAILEQAATEAPGGKLSKAVAKRTDQSERTVKRRVAELVQLGALEKSGGGSTTTYLATGLI